MSDSRKLSVVVPAYQEAATIVEALTRLEDALLRSNVSHEVIVVCDGCTDGTADEAKTLVGSLPLKIVSYEPNHGKGHALVVGSKIASGDAIAFFDADLDIDPSSLVTLYEQLWSTDADGVVGSKFHRDSIVNYPLVRRLQSKIFMSVVFLLFRMKIRDTQTGAKVFREVVIRETVPDIKPTGFGFDVGLMVLAHDRGFRIEEGPVRLTYQYTSSVNAKAVVQMIKDIVNLYRDRKVASKTQGSTSTKSP